MNPNRVAHTPIFLVTRNPLDDNFQDWMMEMDWMMQTCRVGCCLVRSEGSLLCISMQ